MFMMPGLTLRQQYTLIRSLWLPCGALAYFIAARLGMALFSLQPHNITLLWLPAGIGLVMYRHGGKRALPWIFAASFLANYPGMALDAWPRHLLHTFISAAADTLAAWLAATLLHRALPRGLNRPFDLLVFGTLVCIVPTLVSALLLTANLLLGAYITWAQADSLLGTLMVGDSLGILLVYLVFDAWRRPIPAGQSAESLVWIAVTLLALWLVHTAFTRIAGLIYLLPPLLLYQIFYCRARAVYATLLLVVCKIIAMAAHDLGPFDLASTAQAHFMLIAFLFSLTLVIAGMTLQHHALAQEQRSSRTWEFRAKHDPLTGLDNRLMFKSLLDKEHERATRLGHPFTVGMIDIDHFKLINDSYGHLAGDQVLVALACQLQEQLRGIDTVARIGGEEFAVLFPETGLAAATQALERLRLNVEQSGLPIGTHTIRFTISGGVAEFSPGHNVLPPEALLDQADQLLYAAKRAGRNRIVAN